MRVLSIGLDNRALNGQDGHSRRWNTCVGERIERIDVIVEVPRPPESRDIWLTNHFRILPVHALHPLLYSWAACRAGLQFHERQPYDLVTAEDPFRTGLAALWFKQATGVPLNVGYHTETFFNREWLSARPLIHRVYDRIGRRVMRHADSIQCVNDRNREQLRQVCGGRRDPLIDVIPVPVAFYDPARHGERARALRERLLEGRPGTIILFTGRLAPVKKLDELLTIYPEIEARFPEARLVIVGEGAERERLERQAAGSGLRRVTFTGYVAEEEVLAYYGACDFFVNPAHEETFGRVYIEAMSAGKAVITTSGAGAVAQGLCVDRQTALVVPPGDLPALAEALAELLENPALRAELGERGRRQATEQFHYDRTVQRVIELWEQTLLRSGKPPAPAEPRQGAMVRAGRE